MNVYNNMIVNNVSTHEGGGIALDDAPNVRVYNNTVMKNLTTATAVTSATAAGSRRSLHVAEQRPAAGHAACRLAAFSNPLLFNNIFWDNRAGTRAGTTVTGIGLAGDATPDQPLGPGGADGTGRWRRPTRWSSRTPGTHRLHDQSDEQLGIDPVVVSTYDVSVTFAAVAAEPGLRGRDAGRAGAAADLLRRLPPVACPGSPACNLGRAKRAAPTSSRAAVVAAPALDIDEQARPALGGFDSGADEVGVRRPCADDVLDVGNTNPPAWPARPTTRTSTAGTAPPSLALGRRLGDHQPAAAGQRRRLRPLDDNALLRVVRGRDVPVPGPDCSVPNEDVVSTPPAPGRSFFDGSANGLLLKHADLDAISFVGAIGCTSRSTTRRCRRGVRSTGRRRTSYR